MLFEFELRPVMDIEPFGQPPHQYLNWTGLTDGWFWINMGGAKLFQYTPSLLRPPHRFEWEPPYATYNLAAFWESLLDLLPVITEPLPPALIDRLHPAESWFRYFDHLVDWMLQSDDGAAMSLFDDATGWLRLRRLDTGYLQHSPNIWFWSDGAYMHILWDNRACIAAAEPVWTAQMGSYSMPMNRFVRAVKSFDGRLMQAMARRVRQAHEYWPRPEVALNLRETAREHLQRAHRLKTIAAKIRHRAPGDWAQTLNALALIESAPDFTPASLGR